LTKVSQQVNDNGEYAADQAKAASASADEISLNAQVAAMGVEEMSASIKENDFQNTIASAVEEQTATTNEIFRNVAGAARGTLEIAKNITNVAETVESTTSVASNTLKSAGELPTLASELQALVNQFKY
jgi:methyl-accepting chemotaxis protein